MGMIPQGFTIYLVSGATMSSSAISTSSNVSPGTDVETSLEAASFKRSFSGSIFVGVTASVVVVTKMPQAVPVTEAGMQRRSICFSLRPYWHAFEVPMVLMRGNWEKTHG